MNLEKLIDYKFKLYECYQTHKEDLLIQDSDDDNFIKDSIKAKLRMNWLRDEIFATDKEIQKCQEHENIKI